MTGAAGRPPPPEGVASEDDRPREPLHHPGLDGSPAQQRGRLSHGRRPARPRLRRRRLDAAGRRSPSWSTWPTTGSSLMDEAGVDYAVLSVTSPGRRAVPRRGGQEGRPGRQRPPGRSHQEVSRPLRRFRLAGAQGPRVVGAGARALRQGAGLQGLEHPLQLRRLLPRRQDATGPSWPRPRSSTFPSTCTRPCP